MTVSTSIIVGAIALAASVVGVLQWQSRSTEATLGFWFGADVTFAVHAAGRIGGVAITVEEQARIRSAARSEVERAFEPFGLPVTDRSDASFRVVVRQAIWPGRFSPARYTGAAGQAYMIGPFGNYSAVNFLVLAAQAMSYAPPEAGRETIIDAIGRGIGRAAVHEFVHQLLPRAAIDRVSDEASYEYGSANRQSQYYGELHWTIARTQLSERYDTR